MLPVMRFSFLFSGTGGAQSHCPAAVQETPGQIALTKHVLSASRSLGAQQLGFNTTPASCSCTKPTLNPSQAQKAPHKQEKSFLLLSWSCPH